MTDQAADEPRNPRAELLADMASAFTWGAIAMIVTYIVLRPDELRRVRMLLQARQPMPEAQAKVERAVQELRRDLNQIEHSWPSC